MEARIYYAPLAEEGATCISEQIKKGKKGENLKNKVVERKENQFTLCKQSLPTGSRIFMVLESYKTNPRSCATVKKRKY